MPKLRISFCFVSRPFCCPMTMTGLPSKKAMPANDRGIVGKGAIAMQLHEVREQPLDVVERSAGASGDARTAPVPRPDSTGAGVAAAAE